MRKELITVKVAIIIFLALGLFAQSVSAQQYASIGKGVLHVLGIGLTVDPSQQTVPINMGTGVNTKLAASVSGFDIPLPQNLTIAADLTGPGLSKPLSITTSPNGMLMIPPLPSEGTYILDNIRLMSGDQVILYANPTMASIDTIRKLLITQVTSRALSIDEIESLGININSDNFTAYKFTVGFGTETGTVNLEIPVVMDRRDYREDTVQRLSPKEPEPDMDPVLGLKVPNFQIIGVQMMPPVGFMPIVPPIAGVIVIPGDIAFLNQFFEVMLLVTNNAPLGTNLVVTDVNASITLPAGNDNIPGTPDDPLRIANTNQGAFSTVPVINKNGGRELAAQGSGEGKFLVEGLREGTHEVDIEFTGILQGLPVGPVNLKGKAKGTVIVRNPYFTLTFGQPDVVRDGEEYSLFVTINNISETDANLATLTLPPSETYGAALISDSDPSTPLGTVRFRTIKARDSAVAEFRLISRKTGRVTSTAFVGDDGVKGVFRLRTGVGDRGIPLSPDTLVLSNYVKYLPADLVYNAMRVLGMAHSVATAPALPQGVTRISKSMVAKKAYDITEAGLRVKMGEPLANSVSDLIMDWLGNGAPDKGFEEVLRQTSAGRDFLFEAGNIIGSSSSIDAQRAFGEVVKYRTAFISAVIENSGLTSAYLEITDSSGKSLGRRNDGSALRDIPYGVIVDLDGDPNIASKDMALLGDVKNGDTYDVKIKGINPGYINFGFIIPDANGGFIHAVYRNIEIKAGETLTGQIVSGAQAPVLDRGPLKVYPSEVYSYNRNAGPKVISAMQLSEADNRNRGRVVAVLFDEKIKPETANNPENYKVVYRTLTRKLVNPPKEVKILPSRRIIYVMFQCTISPFFEYDMILSGIKDPSLNPQEPEPVRAPIIPTLTNPGGIVSGTVRKGNSDPIPFTEVLLWEVFRDAEGGYIDAEGGYIPVITNRTVTDENGNYQFDYLAMNANASIESSDPETGQKGSVVPHIIMDRQHLVLDILLLGLGTLKGQVVKAEDNSPVAKAYVEVSSLTDNTVLKTLADENGRFIIRMAPVGNMNIYSQMEYYKGSIGANIPQSGATVEIVVPVYDTHLTGAVKGRVLEADGKTPVLGLPVIIQGRDYSKWKTTDAQGNYQFDGVPAGDVSVSTFRQETGEQARVNISVISKETAIANLVLPGTAKIVGTVYNYKGETMPGINIIAGITLVTTDKNGNYVIEKAPIGRTEVRAQDPRTKAITSATADIGSPGEIVTVNITFPAPQMYGTIQGYVKDPYGKPVSYQQIIFWDGGHHYYASTDRNGFFIKQFPLGSFSVRMTNSDGSDGDTKDGIQLAIDGQTATLELSFKGLGAVTGTVYQPDGESPTVASVIITKTRFRTDDGRPYLVQERYISDMLTDKGVSGKYLIEKVRVGDFRLEALNAFYSQPVVKVSKVNRPDETVIIDFVLNSTTRISGQVFLANGERAGAGLPLTLKTKTITEMQVKTKEDGTYEFNLVPPELFTLSVYDPVTGNYGIVYGSVETGDEAVVDINMLGKGTANVKVIDGSGNPIPGAKVGLNSGSRVAQFFGEFPNLYSDQNGEVVFTNVPEGRFSVTAEDSRTLTGGKSGGEIPEDLTEVSVTVIVSASGTVKGTIYTADSSGTVPYAQVKLSISGRPDFFTTSDSDGNYEFAYVPLSAFKLEVFHPGTGRIGKTEGSVDYDTQVKTIDIILMAQGTVEGYVYTASGIAVSGAKVQLRSKEIGGAGAIVMTSNLEGRFKVSGVPEGTYTVSAYDASRRISGMADGKITEEGETVRTDVYLQPTGTIYGKTLAANGINPMPYAKVVISASVFTATTTSDSEGNFSFSLIPVGSYMLSANEQNGFDAGQTTAQVSYEGHLSNVNIIFIGTGNIKGKVVNADGTPLERAADLTVMRTGMIGQRYFKGYTDAEGNFAFFGIPTGDFSITAKVPGSFLGGTFNGTISEDGMSLENIIVEIENSGEIHGTVLRNDNATPVKDALITCTVTKGYMNWVTAYAVSEADGKFSITGIPLGQFTLSIRDYTYGGTGKVSGTITETERIINLTPVALDELPPAVTGMTPAAGSVQIPLNSVITITFSEPVDSYTISSYNIKVSSGSSLISGTLSLSGDRRSVTFRPALNLPEFAPITVTVKNIRDDMGKTMQDTVTSTFTTADITPPRILAARLIKGAFVAEFSEPVVKGSGVFKVINLNTGEQVAGTLTFSAGDMVATLYPLNPLPDNTAFDLLISGYTDSFGNIQSGEFWATYMTGDKIAPTISLTASASTVIEGTPVEITAVPVNSPDIYTVDFRVNGQLVKTVNRTPFIITIVPVEAVTVTAVPIDYAGNIGEESSVTVNTVPNSAPQAAIISPANGSFVGSGRGVTVTAQASDDLGLKEIEMRVRSADVSLTQVYAVSSNVLTASRNFSFSIPSTTVPGNDIRVEVISRDIRNLESEPAVIILKTEDKTLPMVRITSFNKGFHVNPGETIPVTVYASDNWAISRIDFKTEGGLVLSDQMMVEPPSSDAVAQFTLAIPADYVGGTKITVAPSAVDMAGNVGYAPKITLVTDDITPPTVEILSPADGSSIMARSTVKITARASDNDVIDRVEFFIDGKLFATDKYPVNGVYDASFAVPTSEGTTMTLSVRSYDLSGNGSNPAAVTVRVVKDNILPVITMLTNPAALRFTEGHSANISVKVTDNVGVSAVELLVDNRIVSSFVNPSGSSLTFNYLVENLIPQGMNSIIVPLEVKARDLEGNETTSGIYNIEIFKDNPPTVSFLSPKSGQNVLGGARIRIEAKATDDFGIKSIELKVNGITLSKVTGSTIAVDYDIPVSVLGSKINIEALAIDTLDKSTTNSIEVNAPISVSQVSELSTAGEVIDITIYNGYAYALEKGTGISVIDVRNVSSPVKVSTLSLQGNNTGLDTFDGAIYIYGTSGITIIDAADPYIPKIISSYITPNPVTDIAFRSGYAYCAMGNGGILILDVHDPKKPGGIIRNISSVNGVDIEDGYLFISHGSQNPSLSVYSLTDPLNPVRLSTYSTGPANFFDYEGSTGIGITGNNRLTSFGYNQTSGFTKLSDITLRSSMIKNLDLKGQYAIQSSGLEGWGMIEVSGNGGLYDMGTIISGVNTNNVVLQGGHIYSADGTAGIKIYRIDTLNTISPSVNITSPVSGSSVEKGAEIEIRADVTNGDNASVAFYINGKEVFTDEAAPYSYRFRVPTNITTLTIKAKAYNLNGLYAESPEIILNVIEETVPPTITITSPTLGGTTPTFFEGETISVKGSAQDNFGISRVELFVNNSLVDYTLLSSFELKYLIPDDGVSGTDYLVEVLVRATDVSGNISEVRFNVHVIEDNPPQISFITPQPGAIVYSGTIISLSVNAVDDRAIKEVRFYEGNVFLGTDTLPSGNLYSVIYRVPDVSQDETRILKAEAIDIAGQTAVAEASITVKPSQQGVIISVGDNAVTVDIQGDIAVTGGSNGVLRVYNIGVPTSPVLLGSLNLNINLEIKQVKIVGSRVYVADSYYMRIIDITNPANPVQLSATGIGYTNYSIDVFDNIAFVGRSGAYIYVYDVRNGGSPVQKSYKYLGGTIQDVKIDGLTGRLYAVVDNGTNSYLSVLDANNITNLTEIGRVTIPGNPRRLEVVGDKAYIAVKSGMVILSLSRLGTADFGKDGDGDGRADDILSYITTTGGAYDVEVKGNYAYLADGLFNGVKVIDISNPSAPLETAKITTPGDAIELNIEGSYAYLADGYAGLSVVRLYNETALSPGIVLNITITGKTSQEATLIKQTPSIYDKAFGIDVAGNYAYVVDGTSLNVYEVAALEAPIKMVSLNSFTDGRCIKIKDGFAYVLDREYGLYVIDIRHPENPWIIADLPINGNPESLDITQNYLYIALGSSGVRIIDISNPYTPFEAGSLSIGGNAIDVDISGNFAYISSDSGIKIYDISKPRNPMFVGDLYMQGIQKVVLEEDIILVITDDNNGTKGITLMDISDPKAPKIISNIPMDGNILDIDIEGSYIFFTEEFKGIGIIDISNPVLPVTTSIYENPSIKGIKTVQNLIYEADEVVGLRIIDFR